MKHILITIDVEDWFQVENFKPQIPFDTWSSCELRVEKNTHQLLDLFDQLEISGADNPKSKIQNPNLYKVRCTFFILGWIAERLPALVRVIHNRGHEVASHGYNHNPCTTCSTEALKSDLLNSKKRLEDIINAPVYGYRAPSFSINNEILTLIEECGYCYDSSYNSFALHGRYGKMSISNNGHPGIAIPISSTPKFNIQNPKFNIFYELPISNLELKLRTSNFELRALVFPFGGGAYFRLIPLTLFKHGVQSILNKRDAYLFYMHPWELDPKQHRVKNASYFAAFRHYTNLHKTESKLFDFDC